MSLLPSALIRHIKTYLPRFTDLFTETLAVTSASVSVGNILTVNSTAHGKSPGQYLAITAGSVRNSLASTSLSDDIVTFETVYDHDLTKPSLINDDYFLTLGGFLDSFDGTHQIVGVPNRRTFEIALPTGAGAAPSIGGIVFPIGFPILFDGGKYLLESIPAGAYQIDTVPDVDSFTIDLSSARTLPIGYVDGLEVISGYRISAAADINRARDIYSKQDTGKAYLFLIMTDTDVSKDRDILNDSIAELNRNDMMILRLLQSFSTTVFLPTTDDIAGVNAQELAYGEVFTALLKSLFGYTIDGGMTKSVSVPAGMGPGEYNSAFYTHVYDWQLPFVINYEDALPIEPDVAFRDIDYHHLIGGDDTENMTVIPINIDEVPL